MGNLMSKREVLLSCGCYRVFDPVPMNGDYVLCVLHNRGVTVKEGGLVQTGPGEYWNRCMDCKSSRYYGNSELTAEHKARKHTERNPSHTVVILGPDGSEHATYGPATGQGLLFGFADDMPT